MKLKPKIMVLRELNKIDIHIIFYIYTYCVLCELVPGVMKTDYSDAILSK